MVEQTYSGKFQLQIVPHNETATFSKEDSSQGPSLARSYTTPVTHVTLSHRVKSLTSSNQHPIEEVSILPPVEIEEEKQSELSVDSAKAHLKGDSGCKDQPDEKE